MGRKSSSNFFSNLGKGFIRSAVNQVGRDSGKVVSNAIYGDRHATPVRGVGSSGPSSAADPLDGLKPDEDGVVTVARPDLEVSTSRMCLYALLGFAFNFIGAAFLLYNGIKRLTRKNVTVKRFMLKDVYTPDETKEQGRFDGRQAYIQKDQAPKTEHDVYVDNHVGSIYVILGIIILAFYAVAVYANMSPQ